MSCFVLQLAVLLLDCFGKFRWVDVLSFCQQIVCYHSYTLYGSVNLNIFQNKPKAQPTAVCAHKSHYSFWSTDDLLSSLPTLSWECHVTPANTLLIVLFSCWITNGDILLTRVEYIATIFTKSKVKKYSNHSGFCRIGERWRANSSANRCPNVAPIWILHPYVWTKWQ